MGVGYEVRAGLSTVYAEHGWVAADMHSESGSRTLDYAYDDYAVSLLAKHMGKTSDAAFFMERALRAPFTIFNKKTGFMEARNADGSWAGPDAGWTEGGLYGYQSAHICGNDCIPIAWSELCELLPDVSRHFVN